eukprot:g44448.t1
MCKTSDIYQTLVTNFDTRGDCPEMEEEERILARSGSGLSDASINSTHSDSEFTASRATETPLHLTPTPTDKPNAEPAVPAAADPSAAHRRASDPAEYNTAHTAGPHENKAGARGRQLVVGVGGQVGPVSSAAHEQSPDAWGSPARGGEPGVFAADKSPRAPTTRRGSDPAEYHTVLMAGPATGRTGAHGGPAGLVGSAVLEQSPDGNWLRYNVLLGRGAFKKVWLGINRQTGQRVAWSIIELDQLSDEQINKVRKESRILSSLHHPHILRLLACWEAADNSTTSAENYYSDDTCTSNEAHHLTRLNIITEKAEDNLKGQLEKLHPLPLHLLKSYTRQLLEALDYIHSRNPPVVHRDIKLDNVLLTIDGTLKLGDFGLSLEGMHAKSMVGTPGHIAPEVFLEKYTSLADIWSLGILLLELVTKERPFQEALKDQRRYFEVALSGAEPPELELVTNPSIKAFISMCLQRESSRPTARQLLDQSVFPLKPEEAVHSPLTLEPVDAFPVLDSGLSSLSPPTADPPSPAPQLKIKINVKVLPHPDPDGLTPSLKEVLIGISLRLYATSNNSSSEPLLLASVDLPEEDKLDEQEKPQDASPTLPHQPLGLEYRFAEDDHHSFARQTLEYILANTAAGPTFLKALQSGKGVDLTSAEEQLGKAIEKAVKPYYTKFLSKTRQLEVLALLTRLEIDHKYAANFEQQEVGVQDLHLLKGSDLESLIGPIGPRRRLEQWIQQQQELYSPRPSPTQRSSRQESPVEDLVHSPLALSHSPMGQSPRFRTAGRHVSNERNRTWPARGFTTPQQAAAETDSNTPTPPAKEMFTRGQSNTDSNTPTPPPGREMVTRRRSNTATTAKTPSPPDAKLAASQQRKRNALKKSASVDSGFYRELNEEAGMVSRRKGVFAAASTQADHAASSTSSSTSSTPRFGSHSLVLTPSTETTRRFFAQDVAPAHPPLGLSKSHLLATDAPRSKTHPEEHPVHSRNHLVTPEAPRSKTHPGDHHSSTAPPDHHHHTSSHLLAPDAAKWMGGHYLSSHDTSDPDLPHVYSEPVVQTENTATTIPRGLHPNSITPISFPTNQPNVQQHRRNSDAVPPDAFPIMPVRRRRHSVPSNVFYEPHPPAVPTRRQTPPPVPARRLVPDFRIYPPDTSGLSATAATTASSNGSSRHGPLRASTATPVVRITKKHKSPAGGIRSLFTASTRHGGVEAKARSDSKDGRDSRDLVTTTTGVKGGVAKDVKDNATTATSVRSIRAALAAKEKEGKDTSPAAVGHVSVRAAVAAKEKESRDTTTSSGNRDAGATVHVHMKVQPSLPKAEAGTKLKSQTTTSAPPARKLSSSK